MTSLLFVFGLSFTICVVLTPIVRYLAEKNGLVDQPDGRRKVHTKVTPLGGGIAILLSWLAAVVIAATASPLSGRLRENAWWLGGLCVSSVILALVGLADDRWKLRGRHKLMWQLLAIALLLSCGVMVRRISVFGWDIELGLLSIPFTAFLLLGAINSLNLLDGMDGLLSCIGLIICVAMSAMAMISERWAAACVSFAMAGALLGFLRYNFPPASIFMGDCGSMTVGLVIGVLAIQSSLKGPATAALAAPLAVLTIPIFDSLAAIIRRKLTGHSLYSTDRGHLHHCLLRRGFSTRRTLLYVACFGLITMAGALTSTALKNEFWAILSAFAVVGIMILGRLFGFAEFVLVRNHLQASVAALFRGSAEAKSDRVEVRIQGSADWNRLWEELLAMAEPLDLQRLCLSINSPALQEGYLARWNRGDEDPDDLDLWRAQIPLVVNNLTLGRLEMVGRHAQESPVGKIEKLSRLIEDLHLIVPLHHGPALVSENTEAARNVDSEGVEQLPIHIMVIDPSEAADPFRSDEDADAVVDSLESDDLDFKGPNKPR